MEKKIEPFKIRVNSEQAKVVRERMSVHGVADNVSDDYDFDEQRYSCISCRNNSIIAYFDISGINAPKISFEDFLNMFPETRKIIGYSIKPEFETQRKSIAAALGNALLEDKRKPYDFYSSSTIKEVAKDLGTLNIWFDPVYEEERPETRIFTIAGNTWLCEKGTRIAKSENGTIIADINDINNALNDAESNIKNESIKAEKYKELISFMENK